MKAENAIEKVLGFRMPKINGFVVTRSDAEMIFKAGYDKALAQLADMTEECKQMGRKEVVGFVETFFALLPMPRIEGNPYNQPIEWQAKLKEWGIK